ncbi:MAG: hypothetical protein LBT48_04715 [Prevotellaceae bacterium]|nr:hypothetical protein [Prevotellaceae bacterium]
MVLLILLMSGNMFLHAQIYQDEARRKKSEESLKNIEEFFSFIFFDAGQAYEFNIVKDNIVAGYIGNRKLRQTMDYFQSVTRTGVCVRCNLDSDRYWAKRFHIQTPQGNCDPAESKPSFTINILLKPQSKEDTIHQLFRPVITIEKHLGGYDSSIDSTRIKAFEQYMADTLPLLWRKEFFPKLNDKILNGLLMLMGVAEAPVVVDLQPLNVRSYDACPSVVTRPFYDDLYIQGLPTRGYNNDTIRVAWVSMKKGESLQLKGVVKEMLPDTAVTDARMLQLKRDNSVQARFSSKDTVQHFTVSGFSTGDNRIKAVYQLEEGKGVDVMAGQLNVAAYKEETYKVVIVPLKGVTAPPESEIKETLNRIYGQAVVSWDVSVDKRLENYSHAVEIPIDLSTREPYSEGMEAVISEFKKGGVNRKTRYVFLLSAFDNYRAIDIILGYMPFSNQYGFVESGKLTDRQTVRTIAHELGHGAFGLRHTFKPDYGIDDATSVPTRLNLMGYNDSIHLAKFQWDIIHNHSGEVEFDSTGQVAAMIIASYYWTPSGHVIYLESPTKGVTISNDVNFPNGTLYGFYENNIKYIAKIENNLFYGYTTENGGLYRDKTKEKLDAVKADTLTVISRIYDGNCTTTEYKNRISRNYISVLPDCSSGLPLATNEYFQKTGEKGDVLQIEGCNKINFSNLTETGKNIYNANKNWIPEADHDVLLEIATVSQDFDADIYNSFVDKQKHNGAMFWNNTNKPADYTRENLKNTLEQFKKYQAALAALNKSEFASCDELVSHITNNFQITKGSNNILVFPADPKYVSIIIAPFKTLTLERKKQLIDLLHACSYSTLQNIGDNIDAGAILATIFKTSNEISSGTDPDAKALIDYIADKKYLKHFVEDLYGVQYEGFMNALLNMVLKNYKYDGFKIGDPEKNPNYLKFSPDYLQFNSENILDDGNVQLEVKRWFGDNKYTVTGHPYAPVAVEFAKEVKFGKSLTFKKGDIQILPMIWAYQLFWKDTKAARWKTVQITAEVGLTALGVGEITAAVRFYRAGQTARATFIAIKALGDLGVGFSDIYIQNSDVLTDEQLQKWNTFVLLYFAGSISTSAIDGLAQKYTKKVINSQADFNEFERALNENVDDALKNSSSKALIEEVVGVAKGGTAVFDLSIFKNLTAQIPSGKNLTNLKKTQFTEHGYKLKPIEGALKNKIDDIIANGDNLGTKTESIVDDIMTQNGYAKLDGKYGSNNGYDGLYIKGSIENPTEIIIVESKQFKYTNGVADEIIEHSGVSLNQPSGNTPLPAQMSDDWIKYVAEEKLINLGGDKTQLANAIINSPQGTVKKYVAAVDKTQSEINFLKLGNY